MSKAHTEVPPVAVTDEADVNAWNQPAWSHFV